MGVFTLPVWPTAAHPPSPNIPAKEIGSPSRSRPIIDPTLPRPIHQTVSQPIAFNLHILIARPSFQQRLSANLEPRLPG
jgi:hypothetical protein